MIGTDFIDIGWLEGQHPYLEIRYSVYFSDGTFIGDAGTALQYRVVGLTPDTEYSFYVISRVTYPDNLGIELVTNGTFTADSFWTKGVGWNIVPDPLTGHANNDGQAGSISQGVQIVGGRTYYMSFETDAAAYGGLGLKYRLGSTAFSGAVSGDGVHEFEQVAGTDDTELSFSSDVANDFLGNLRKISVKELLRSAETVYSEPSIIVTVSTLPIKIAQFYQRIADDGGTLFSIDCEDTSGAEFSMSVAGKAGKLYCQKRTIGTVEGGYPLSVDDFTVARALEKWVRGSDGLMVKVGADIPAFQWDLGDTCPYLFTEVIGENLLEQSNTFSDNNWIKAETTIIANSDIGPDGGLSATTVTPNALGGDTTTGDGSTNNRLFRDVGNPNNQFTSSLWVKSKSGSNFTASLHIQDSASDTLRATTTFTVNNVWQRVQVTGSTSGVITGNRFTLQTEQAILVWEGQSEVGSRMSSNITTLAASVIRPMDFITGAGNADSFNGAVGSLAVRTSVLVDDGTKKYYSISDGTRANRITIYYTAANTISVLFTIGSVTQAFYEHTGVDVTLPHNIVFTWSYQSFELWVDGIKVYSGFIGSGDVFAPGVLNTCQYSDGDSATEEAFIGKTRNFRVYKRVLSTAEIPAIFN